MLNRVILDCRVVGDVDYRNVGSTGKASFRIASNRYFKNKDGNRMEKTLFIDIEAWGGLAETCVKYLKKGRRILVEGRLELDQWMNNGEKRSKIYITAESVHFLDSKQEGNQTENFSSTTEEVEEVPF